jgi:hypothetical protein
MNYESNCQKLLYEILYMKPSLTVRSKPNKKL